MSNEVVKASDWQAQIDLVKRMYAKDATDDEFKLMSHIAVKYELDPLVKQIWLVKYGTQPASIVRTYVPRFQQRNTFIQPTLEHASAGEAMNIQAVAFAVRAYGERTSR